MTEIELRAGPARLIVVPSVGGSIASFEYDGEPILRPTTRQALADGTVRSLACFPLIPFSNRIADASLQWAGRQYALQRYVGDDRNAIHGNGWQRAWHVTGRSASLLTIELEHDALGARAHEWPFPYRARQRFELVVDARSVRLMLELGIENVGPEAFPFGLGWHPYFHRDSDTELGFSAAAVWATDPSHLPARPVSLATEWDFDQTRIIGSTLLDNCFVAWQPPAVVRWPARKLTAEIAASPACSFLVVFIPGGEVKPFFALEPVTHMTDAFNRSSGIGGTGTRVLAPGASFSCTMSISVSRNN